MVYVFSEASYQLATLAMLPFVILFKITVTDNRFYFVMVRVFSVPFCRLPPLSPFASEIQPMEGTGRAQRLEEGD